MKRIFITFFALVTYLSSFGQTDIAISESHFNYNSIGEGSITVDFMVPIGEDVIDDEDFFELNENVHARLVSTDGTAFNNASLTIAVTRISIRIIIEKLTAKDLETIENNPDQFFIEVDKKIRFNTNSGANHSIDPAEVKKHSQGKIVVTSDIRMEIINAAGGPVWAIQNMLDFGVSPRKDTTTDRREYFVQFGYRKAYTIKSRPFFFFAEGLLSTHSDDSLTFVNVYPVNYKLPGKDNEIVAQLGVEGNQRFTNFRASGTLYWQGLIPNVVDFTMGEDRLRLKPVLKLGVKLYQEFENNRPATESSTEFSNQFYSEFYYYIPVKKLYSLTLRGNAFYDLNDKVNPEKEVKFNYSVVFGIEIPQTGLKTIFKYLRGENGITYERDEVLMIGFMADLFNVQKK